MVSEGLKKRFKILLLSLLLSVLTVTAHATTLSPRNGTTFTPAANEFLPYTSSTTLSAGGCIGGTYTWTASGLPTGLNLNSITGTTNTITGTPTQSGSFTFTVRVSGSGFLCWGSSVTNTYYITVNPRCQFSGGSTGSISFTIDPTLAGPIYNTVTQNVNFQCGPGTTYSYSLLPVQPNLTGTRNTIPYTLSAGQGLSPFGQNTSDSTLIPLLTTLSQVLQADYQNAYAETDNSTETVTISWTGPAAGSITATVNAVGTVINACSVSGSPSLNFGALDAATNAGGATATVISPTIMCTMGDAISVTNNGGLNFSGTPRMKSGTNYLNYNFNSAGSMTGAGGTTNIGGTGTGNLNLGATISTGALDNVPAGAYSDTVTITIDY
ncbi:MAG: hypothetical protein APR62_01500 [Smithella sp. SDB]|nr:MAG: hypothetical protein APR62_01500 [Smithella sp. SDB]